MNQPGLYNRKVKYKSILSFSVVFGALVFLSACSTKKSSKSTSIWDESSGNPVLLEEEYVAQQKGELPRFNMPLEQNAQVETWLNYFQGRGRKWFGIWMERSGRYIPFMRKILREEGLPEDLVYLAMIESGFSSRAYSRAAAVGHWQFMRATGRMYGLKVNFWMDERRDPEKATIAAARHMKDLYDRFQDWKLAAAAYNAGAGKISRAIRRYRTEDFWELTRGRYLARETKNYVPKLIAAAMIAKNPTAYGFVDIEYQQPLAFDKIVLRKQVNLKSLAKKAGHPFEKIQYLNPELNHPVTPPEMKTYELRVPAGSSETFLKAYENLGPEDAYRFASHTIRRGDTISQIARFYGISSNELMSLNKVRFARRLRPGQVLLLPIPEGTPVRKATYRPVKKVSQPSVQRVASGDDYVVQNGDNLWLIAKAHGLSVYSIQKANGLRSNRLQPGQRLVIPGKSGTRAARVTAKAPPPKNNHKVVHVVRQGESLWSISKQYGSSISEIKSRNNLRRNTIQRGDRLVIPST